MRTITAYFYTMAIKCFLWRLLEGWKCLSSNRKNCEISWNITAEWWIKPLRRHFCPMLHETIDWYSRLMLLESLYFGAFFELNVLSRKLTIFRLISVIYQKTNIFKNLNSIFLTRSICCALTLHKTNKPTSL